MSRERDDRGQFVETISLDDVISAVRGSSSPVATAKEVADELDCSAEAARQKLLALRDQGIVSRRTVGAGAVVWWVSTEDPDPERDLDVDPDDPLFTGGALFSSDDPVEEDEIDDVLYGDPGE